MTTTNNFTPVANACQTILGCTVDLENSLPVTRRNDVTTTINTKRTILPSTIPPNGGAVSLKYFGIGIGGRTFSATKTSVAPVSALNMDLYTPIPFRVVPIDQDLSAADRAQYRMRTIIKTAAGQFVAYWLKLITFNDTQVSYTIANAQNTSEPYTIDTSYLNPTVPAVTANGTVVDPAAGLDIGCSVTLPVTGAEVLEAINVLYGGDTDMAIISEFGIYSGADVTNITTDYLNNTLSYTEVAMAQLAQHYTWGGSSAAFGTAVVNGGFKLSSSTLVMA